MQDITDFKLKFCCFFFSPAMLLKCQGKKAKGDSFCVCQLHGTGSRGSSGETVRSCVSAWGNSGLLWFLKRFCHSLRRRRSAPAVHASDLMGKLVAPPPPFPKWKCYSKSYAKAKLRQEQLSWVWVGDAQVRFSPAFFGVGAESTCCSGPRAFSEEEWCVKVLHRVHRGPQRWNCTPSHSLSSVLSGEVCVPNVIYDPPQRQTSVSL